MTRVLLMAAGAGSRFGGDVPKPFIDVNGLPMWHYVAKKMGMVRAADGGPFVVSLIVRSDHQGMISATDLQGYSPVVDNIKFIRPMIEQGPAWSVIGATLDMTTEEDIYVVDSDCYVEDPRKLSDKHRISHFKQMESMRPRLNIDAVAFAHVAFHADPSAMGALFSSGDEPLIASSPGVKTGQLANTGTYWFRSVRQFRSAVSQMPFYADNSKELKLADVFNHFRRREFQRVAGVFHNLGTPEHLTNYMKDRVYGPTEPTV